MTCVSKEHEIKTKMVHEQWLLLKMKYSLDYNFKMLFSGGELTFGGEGG